MKTRSLKQIRERGTIELRDLTKSRSRRVPAFFRVLPDSRGVEFMLGKAARLRPGRRYSFVVVNSEVITEKKAASA